MKVIIVGGVAGGASCAARLRRLDEKAEILMVERGPHVSYAYCGLPYHVGGVIEKESSLLVANEALFRSQFDIDVWTRVAVPNEDPAIAASGKKSFCRPSTWLTLAELLSTRDCRVRGPRCHP